MLANEQVQALGKIAKTQDNMRAGAELLRRQVEDARRAGASWDAIGRMLGVTGEAVRVKYGQRRRVVLRTVEAVALF